LDERADFGSKDSKPESGSQSWHAVPQPEVMAPSMPNIYTDFTA